MKLKEEYVLEKIANKWVVIDTNAKSINFNKMLVINDTGRFIFKKLEKDISKDELVNELIKYYDVEKQNAIKDIDNFIKEINKLGYLDE